MLGADKVVVETVESRPLMDDSSTLAERLLKFAGAAEGLPSDMSYNHDHYIHGTPRRGGE